MYRRAFLAALPALGLAPAIAFSAGAPPARITDIKTYQLRVVREVGKPPGAPPNFISRQGGGGFTEYFTDQGVTGIGPLLDPNTLAAATKLLVGQSPYLIVDLVARMPRPDTGAFFAGTAPRMAPVEIGLWDLYGKLLGQPLYKIWGGRRDRILVYASLVSRGSSPEERADIVKLIRSQGWRAIKMRPHWETMRDDIRMVELARKAAGDDFIITVDPNQAGGVNPSGVTWDFKRAADTGKAFQDLGVWWMEEPLHRSDLEGLAELNRLFTMKIVGGEGNFQVNEFRNYIAQRCYDMLQPEIMAIGPTALLRIEAMARPFNIDVVPHSGFGNLGTMCQLHFVAATGAPIGEWHHDPPNMDYMNDLFIFENPPQVKDGYLAMPQGPGLGLTIKRDLII